jgi:hypothetical protein
MMARPVGRPGGAAVARASLLRLFHLFRECLLLQRKLVDGISAPDFCKILNFNSQSLKNLPTIL